MESDPDLLVDSLERGLICRNHHSVPSPPDRDSSVAGQWSRKVSRGVVCLWEKPILLVCYCWKVLIGAFWRVAGSVGVVLWVRGLISSSLCVAALMYILIAACASACSDAKYAVCASTEYFSYSRQLRWEVYPRGWFPAHFLIPGERSGRSGACEFGFDSSRAVC